MKRIALTILLVCGAALRGQAQGEFWTWCLRGGVGSGSSYLGEVKVSFSPRPGPPDSCLYRPYFGAGRISSASLSDAGGQLLVFGDGLVLMDRRNQTMPNGLLNGPTLLDFFWAAISPSYQPLALAPDPASEHRAYAFYWTASPEEGGSKVFALTCAVVDHRLNGGFGDVVRKGQVLGRTRNPRLALVRHANRRDYWVLTCAPDGRGFQAFRLGPAGVDPVPVVSLVGQVLSGGYGELKAAPNGRRLVAQRDNGVPSVDAYYNCVYDFDDASGAVSNEVVVGRSTGYGVFSASFSPNSQLLYTCEFPSRPNPPRRLAELWQTNVSGTSEAAATASRYCISCGVPTPTAPRVGTGDFIEAGGLELAPDGTVWVSQFITHPPRDFTTLAPLTSYTGIIRQPDVAGAGCGFVPEAYACRPGRRPGITLPNVITNMLYAPAALNHEAGCPEDSVRFWASSAGDPAGLRWDFGEPASGPANQANGRQVAHRYARGGTYAVRLALADGRVLTQAVTVAAAAADFTDETVFTPNGDGLNDQFRPVRQPLPGGRLRVFSRWGQPVFATDDPALRWDGAGAAGGEYLYQLDYPDCRGATRHRRGPVLLVR